MLLQLLALLSASAYDENDACPYLLMTGLKRKHQLYDACGYYMRDGKDQWKQVERLSQDCNQNTKTCSKTPEQPHYVYGQRDEERDLWIIGLDPGGGDAFLVAGAADENTPFTNPSAIPEYWHVSDNEGGWVKQRKFKAVCKTKLEDAWLLSFPSQQTGGNGGPAPVFSPAFFDILDLNKDGGLHFQELAESFVDQGMFDGQELGQAEAFFEKYDTNADGFIIRTEWDKAWNQDGKDRAAAQGMGGERKRPILGGTV
jgi:hypothetical protein